MEKMHWQSSEWKGANIHVCVCAWQSSQHTHTCKDKKLQTTMDYENQIFEWETDSMGNNVCICVRVTRTKAAKNDVKHMEYHNSMQIFRRIYVPKQWEIAHENTFPQSCTHTNIFIWISWSDKHSIFFLSLYTFANAITFAHAQI